MRAGAEGSGPSQQGKGPVVRWLRAAWRWFDRLFDVVDGALVALGFVLLGLVGIIVLVGVVVRVVG